MPDPPWSLFKPVSAALAAFLLNFLFLSGFVPLCEILCFWCPSVAFYSCVSRLFFVFFEPFRGCFSSLLSLQPPKTTLSSWLTRCPPEFVPARQKLMDRVSPSFRICLNSLSGRRPASNSKALFVQSRLLLA